MKSNKHHTVYKVDNANEHYQRKIMQMLLAALLYVAKISNN